MSSVNRWLRFIFKFLVFKMFICAINGLHRPNVVIIMADDMGFDDVSFRGSNEFLTPNIDALAYSGLILKNFYASTMCTPSRSALLTGKYPIHTGMQHYVIPNYQPWGLPLNETTMAEIFQQNGYHTSLIGKWHLGMSRQNYTPTFRGFDHHFGYLGSHIDYYDQTMYSPHKTYDRGHDFRRNLNISHEFIGTYVTNLLTEEAINLIEEHNYAERPLFMMLSHLAPHAGNEDAPLQAPIEEIEKFRYIQNQDRRTYAAMMSILDRSVGQVIDALHKNGVLNETILVFLSDNGGPTVGLHSTTASNYPLRGQKNSPWEGGVRSSAAIWCSELSNPGTVWTQKMYIADLLPTLASAAGIGLDSSNLDGLDLWQGILNAANDSGTFEREIVHNIDNIYRYVSLTYGRYKFINGTTLKGAYDHWLISERTDAIDSRAASYEYVIKNTSVWQHLQALNEENSLNSGEWMNITLLRNKAAVECGSASEKRICEPLKAPCLFDIDMDPCEMNNLYEDREHSEALDLLLERVAFHRSHIHRPNNKREDKRCNPKFYDHEWTWWEDIQDAKNASDRMNKTAVQLLAWPFVVYAIKLVVRMHGFQKGLV